MNTLGENAFGAIVLAGGLYVLARGRIHIGWGEGDSDLQLVEGTGARVIGACVVASGALMFHQATLGVIAFCVVLLVSAWVTRRERRYRFGFLASWLLRSSSDASACNATGTSILLARRCPLHAYR